MKTLVAVGAIAVMVLAGCGGDEAGDASSPEASAADTTAPQTDAAGSDTESQPATEAPPAEAVELTAQSYLSEGAALGRIAAWFYDEVEARTDGAVTFDRYWDGSLVEAVGIRDAIADGRLDVGQSSHAYQPESFPLTNVTGIPYVTDNVPAQSAAMTNLTAESDAYRAEWENQGLHLVAFLAVPPSVLGSSEPIDDIGQLEGMQVRGVDRFIPALEAVGANPVSLTAFEVYESLERGVVEAYTGVPFDVVGALALQEVAPHVTDMGQGNYAGAYLAMSTSTWDSLDPSVQQVIDEVAAEIPGLVGEYYAEGEDASCTAFADADGTVSVLPDDQVQAWADAIGDTIEVSWQDGVTAAGGDPTAFYDLYQAQLEDAQGGYSDYESGLARCAESG